MDEERRVGCRSCAVSQTAMAGTAEHRVVGRSCLSYFVSADISFELSVSASEYCERGVKSSTLLPMPGPRFLSRGSGDEADCKI